MQVYKSWFAQKREKLGRNWVNGTNKEKVDQLVRDVTNNAERILTDISKGNINFEGEDIQDLSSPIILDTLIQFCMMRMNYFNLIQRGLVGIRDNNIASQVPSTNELQTAIAASTNILTIYSECYNRLTMYRNTYDITQIIILQQGLKMYSRYIRLSGVFTV